MIKNKYLNLHDNTIFSISILLNVIFIILVFANLNEQQIYTYLNSDTLYLPSIFKDLFIDKSGLNGWHLNGAPNFFPDMLLYFIINTIFKNFITSMFIFSIVQYTAILLLFYKLFKSLRIKIELIHISAANLIMLLFFFVSLITNDFVFTFYLISVSYHLGAFVMTILCLIFTFNYINKKDNKFLYYLLLFGTLATISDRLFIVMYTLPMLSLTILIYFKHHKKTLLKLFTTIFSFTVIGLIIFKILKTSSYIHIISLSWKFLNINNIANSFNVMMEQHGKYISLMDLRGLIVILSAISFLIILSLLIKQLYRIFKTKEINNSIFIETAYLLFSTSFCIIVFFMPVINGRSVGWAMLRYNIYVFYLCIFNYAFIFYVFSRKKNYITKIFQAIITISTIFLIIILIRMSNKTKIEKNLSNFFNYYPKKVKSIDKAAEKNKLKYGVANYWYAKYVTMFSEQNIRLYTVYDNLCPWYHVMNENWYYKNNQGKYKDPEFTFIISNNINDKAIIEKLGVSKDTIKCINDMTILKYEPFLYNKATKQPTKIINK
ncbi:MAG: hypothetical protein PF487_03165 [Bacteroidales bacterium]|jgi:ribosomal protein L23|nr:hypothetical protein [Bacteroidales bacterium]